MTIQRIDRLMRTDSALGGFLKESANVSSDEYTTLTEEFKIDTVKELANSVLLNIKTKASGIDTSNIDRSRGDIKNYAQLPQIQTAIQQLMGLAVGTGENNDLSAALADITTAIANLSAAAPKFKDAYRTKKTLTILRYQSVVLSIIASLSYLISVCVDVGPDGKAALKKNYNIDDTKLLRQLTSFNTSISSELDEAMTEDVNELRKYFSEYNAKQYSTVYEAGDIIGLINQGLDAFNGQLAGNNSKLGGLLYKLSGIITLILSLRDVFYSLYAYKDKVSDFTGTISRFINLGSSSVGQLARFLTSNQHQATDMGNADQRVSNEISAENSQIIHTAQKDSMDTTPITQTIPAQSQPTQSPFANIMSALDKVAEPEPSKASPASQVAPLNTFDF